MAGCLRECHSRQFETAGCVVRVQPLHSATASLLKPCSTKTGSPSGARSADISRFLNTTMSYPSVRTCQRLSSSEDSVNRDSVPMAPCALPDVAR